MTCPNCPEGYDCSTGNYYTGNITVTDQCPNCTSDRREWRFVMPNGTDVEPCADAWHDNTRAVA